VTRALTAVFLAGLFVVACSYSVSKQRSIEVPGDAPIEEKVRIAEQVASSLISPGLHAKVKARFPEVSAAQLENLAIRWQTFKGTQFSTEGSEPFDKFYIQCSITLPKSEDSTDEILEYCRQLLRVELDKALAGERSV
jgi:hypothetical protein